MRGIVRLALGPGDLDFVSEETPTNEIVATGRNSASGPTLPLKRPTLRLQAAPRPMDRWKQGQGNNFGEQGPCTPLGNAKAPSLLARGDSIRTGRNFGSALKARDVRGVSRASKHAEREGGGGGGGGVRVGVPSRNSRSRMMGAAAASSDMNTVRNPLRAAEGEAGPSSDMAPVKGRSSLSGIPGEYGQGRKQTCGDVGAVPSRAPSPELNALIGVGGLCDESMFRSDEDPYEDCEKYQQEHAAYGSHSSGLPPVSSLAGARARGPSSARDDPLHGHGIATSTAKAASRSEPLAAAGVANGRRDMSVSFGRGRGMLSASSRGAGGEAFAGASKTPAFLSHGSAASAAMDSSRSMPAAAGYRNGGKGRVRRGEGGRAAGIV